MIWLLNSAVIPSGGEGVYTYLRSDRRDPRFVEAVRGRHVSRIGYAETADAIERWTGVRPAISRDTYELRRGDAAWVVRLTRRVADPRRKGRHAPSRDDGWEVGFLRCVGDAAAARGWWPC